MATNSGGKNEAELLCAMLEEYDIDEKIAVEDIKIFVSKLRAARMLE